MRILFWGTGNTAREHLWRIKGLSDQVEIIGFTDSRCHHDEDDSVWEEFRLVSPHKIPFLEIDYICILSIWEWEIRKKIYEKCLFDLSNIISIHELCMMSSTGLNMEEFYGHLLAGIPQRLFHSVGEWWDYERLKREYAYILCGSECQKVDFHKKNHLENIKQLVWVVWLQGLDQAPELVKVCIHSLTRGLGKEAHIIQLDKNNLFDYINMPDYILQKWEKGIISNTHFSDLVRLRLLNVYGGVWVDATVYFTGNEIPNYIRSGKLFMFSRWPNWRTGLEAKIAANWLISAQPANRMLVSLEILLNEYWKREDKLVNYCIFHIFWTMVAERFHAEWDQVERILRDPSLLLYRELTCKYNRERFERLKEMTCFHKLTYKNMSYLEADKDSFWGEICRIEGFGKN